MSLNESKNNRRTSSSRGSLRTAVNNDSESELRLRPARKESSTLSDVSSPEVDSEQTALRLFLNLLLDLTVAFLLFIIHLICVLIEFSEVVYHKLCKLCVILYRIGCFIKEKPDVAKDLFFTSWHLAVVSYKSGLWTFTDCVKLLIGNSFGKMSEERKAPPKPVKKTIKPTEAGSFFSWHSNDKAKKRSKHSKDSKVKKSTVVASESSTSKAGGARKAPVRTKSNVAPSQSSTKTAVSKVTVAPSRSSTKTADSKNAVASAPKLITKTSETVKATPSQLDNFTTQTAQSISTNVGGESSCKLKLVRNIESN